MKFSFFFFRTAQKATAASSALQRSHFTVSIWICSCLRHEHHNNMAPRDTFDNVVVSGTMEQQSVFATADNLIRVINIPFDATYADTTRAVADYIAITLTDGLRCTVKAALKTIGVYAELCLGGVTLLASLPLDTKKRRTGKRVCSGTGRLKVFNIGSLFAPLVDVSMALNRSSYYTLAYNCTKGEKKFRQIRFVFDDPDMRKVKVLSDKLVELLQSSGDGTIHVDTWKDEYRMFIGKRGKRFEISRSAAAEFAMVVWDQETSTFSFPHTTQALGAKLFDLVGRTYKGTMHLRHWKNNDRIAISKNGKRVKLSPGDVATAAGVLAVFNCATKGRSSQ